MRSIFDITSSMTLTKGDDIFHGGTIRDIKNDQLYVHGRDLLIKDEDNYIFHILKKEKLGIVFQCDVTFSIDDFFDFLGVNIEITNDCDLTIMNNKDKPSTIKNFKLGHTNTFNSGEIIIDGGLVLNNCKIACETLRGYDGVPKLINSKMYCRDFYLEATSNWNDLTYKDFDLYNKKFESIGLNQKSFDALYVLIFYNKDKKTLHYSKRSHNKSQSIVWQLSR